MKTPADKTVKFVFGSHPEKNPKDRWTAQIIFPPGSVSDTVLPIEVLDGEEEPEKSALLELFGREIPVENGCASITFAQFIEGMHSVPIWLHRQGRKSVPGGLTFR
jgi:hypothetical protein